RRILLRLCRIRRSLAQGGGFCFSRAVLTPAKHKESRVFETFREFAVSASRSENGPRYNPRHAHTLLAADRTRGARVRGRHGDRVPASGVSAGAGGLLARCGRIPALCYCAADDGFADVTRIAIE